MDCKLVVDCLGRVKLCIFSVGAKETRQTWLARNVLHALIFPSFDVKAALKQWKHFFFKVGKK